MDEEERLHRLFPAYKELTSFATQTDFTEWEQHAYLAGDDGTLLRTADRGGSWQPVQLDTHAALYGLEDL